MRSRPKKKRKGAGKAPPPQGRISAWAKTDVGLKREINEDNYLSDSNIRLYIVADGMGGHAGGDTAARMAVDIIRGHVKEKRRLRHLFNREATERESSGILTLLQEAIRDASTQIFDASERNPELAGMGTTVTLMLTHGTRAYVAHVGDSRLYRFRGGTLEQLTEDHSLVNEQVKAGFITAEEAQHSRFKNIITRSVGFESDVTADTFSMMMQPADTYLLCSDGLCGMVEDEVIARALQAARMPEAPGRLVEIANDAGGEDNITVIVLEYNLGSRQAAERRPSRQKRRKRRRARKQRRKEK